MASKDSATRPKTLSIPRMGVSGFHHEARDVFRVMTEEQTAELESLIRDPDGDPDKFFDNIKKNLDQKRALDAPKDEGFDAYMAKWREMTPAQRKKRAAQLKTLRKKVDALPTFKNKSLEVERQFTEWHAKRFCSAEADFKGEEVPVEMYTLERLLSPAAEAWEMATHYIHLALSDDRLQRHPIVKAIFEKLGRAILDHTWDDLATPENVLRFLVDPLAEERARTTGARHAAMAKNEAAREWTQEMWGLWNGSDDDKKMMPTEVIARLENKRQAKKPPKKPLTKEEFSECMADLLKDGIGSQVDPTEVKVRTIYVAWLKGL